MDITKKARLGLFFTVVSFALTGCFSSNESREPSSYRHVASPDWRDQIIYFLMIDRFNDGDPSNNDQGANEFDPTSDKKFSGGDITGVQQKLDYIAGLGATAVWMTPPVANQWWDPAQNYGGYHGYWARDMQKIDEHFGDLATYQALAEDLHKRGMYLIQDIVVNHVGNFFTYAGHYDPATPCQGFELIPGALAAGQSLPVPLSFNDCNSPQAQSAAIYHWTPQIIDHNDPRQQLTYQLSDLDDLNTSTSAVRDYLKQSYRYWIDQVGVDAFRVDTVKYVEHDFYHDFFHSQDGIINKAGETGRRDFLSLGEVFESSSPYKTEGEEKMISYLGTKKKPELDSLLNFPLQATMNQVFAGGRPTAELGFRLRKMMEMYPNPYRLGNFIDNHDMARFLAQGNLDDFKQALFTMLTLPGIPVIYQGTEQAFRGYRDSMFEGGYREDGHHKDSFDIDSEMYRFIQSLTNLRHQNKVLSRGDLSILAEDKSGAGVFAYRRHMEGSDLIVILNTAPEQILLNKMGTRLAAGTRLRILSGLNVPEQHEMVIAEDGTLTQALPPKSALMVIADGSAAIPPQDHAMTLTTPLEGVGLSADLPLSGTGTPGSQLQLVIDGQLETAEHVTVDATGQWQGLLSVRHFQVGEQAHRLAVFEEQTGSSAADIHFKSLLSFPSVPNQTLDDSGDGMNGSGGLNGGYVMPGDASYDKAAPQMAIEKATVYQVGSNVRLSLQMASVTDTWLPTLGFDHVGFSIFIHLPGVSDGLRVLPKLNATMPSGQTWDRQLLVFGWQNSLYSSKGASATRYGKAVTPAPTITVDKATRTINMDFPSASLGRPDSLNGIAFYVTTWDLDGLSSTYRPLLPVFGLWNFSGGTEQDSLIWDELPVLSLQE
ncbi:alpha-amylase family glycosyl hydrolase [Aeromonas bestiarum]|uniref:alpha-amylase family glycosyl hydrolase n=1 Tax=Aeromonas bestiarum TaxID=105751 RepID=UPI003D21F69F